MECIQDTLVRSQIIGPRFIQRHHLPVRLTICLGGRCRSQAGESTQQCCDGQFTLAVNFDREQVLVTGLKFEPGAPVRNKFGCEELAACDGILISSEVDAG